MILDLQSISEISLGTILTRVKPKNELEDSVLVENISMQELSYISGVGEVVSDISTVKISKNKLDKCLFTKENDVVIGLASQRAMVITKERANKLLPSNFCMIRITDTTLLDPYYFMWLINENSSFKKQLGSSMQGVTYVKMFSLDTLRSLQFSVPNIEKQIIIGKIYRMNIERERIEKNILELKSKWLNTILENY